jgi:histidyl-tRNA synthetase
MFHKKEIPAPENPGKHIKLPIRPFSLKADEVAAYFGFTPVEATMPSRQDREYARELLSDVKETMLFIDEDVAFVKRYINDNWSALPHPLLLVSHSSFEKKKACVSLRIMGINGSAAEALAIRTAISLLTEAGNKNLTIALGSIGDRESMNDFDRAIASYTRKNTPLMPPEIKKIFKENPLALLTDKKYKESPFADRFPTTIASLSANSRNLLKEVIEYIEVMNIPYVLDTSLIAPRSCAHQIVFEIRDDQSGETLAKGMRLSPLTRKMGAKRETPFLSVMVNGGIAKSARKKLTEPKFHFVQLGYSAKLLSLPLVENLRQAGVPVMFHISRDKLLSQMGPEDKTPFLIIMGHKEALEKTVVVRDNETRAQESVSIETAPNFIKKVLKKGRV